MRHLIVGTAGHIDHGKSALVEALTGVDPDRLKEEKARGITIDLGFADLDVGEGQIVSFVDVPGHERFVRHMVAGATGIDAVLMVVAADEGVKPQTREHLDICRMLGLSHGIVALTKSDLVDDELREVAALELRELLAGSFLEGAPIVPVSARAGQGLDALKAELRRLFGAVPARPASGVARLPVDRSFVLKGFGTVVTGSLVSGTLAEGDEVELLPGGARGRIRGLQVHRQAASRVVAGQRAAVNLQGLDCSQAPRGATVASPSALTTTRRIWATLDLLPTAPDSLRRGGPVQFHQGTCERRARLRIVSSAPAESDCAEIFFSHPAVLVPGDRFILRRPAPVNTIGGGRVLDIAPPYGRRRVSDWTVLRSRGPGELLRLRLERAGPRGREPKDLAPELGVSIDELEASVAEISPPGIVRAMGRLFDGARWADVQARALAELEQFHEQEPLRRGMSREALRARAGGAMPQDAWRVLLDELKSSGRVALDGELVAIDGHEVVLSAPERALAERIETQFREAGLDPPDLSQALAGEDDERARRIVDLLISRGSLVRIRSGKLFHAGAMGALLEKLRQYAKRSKTIDVGAFKELAGITRKNAIPLLEHLDEERHTRRVGNARQILNV